MEKALRRYNSSGSCRSKATPFAVVRCISDYANDNAIDESKKMNKSTSKSKFGGIEMKNVEGIMTIYEKADDLMYTHGLLKLLQKYGDVYIIGSYRMGIMTWNDIDFYMDKSSLNTQNYYSLTSDIIKGMIPSHFNGEINIENEFAFLGFETKISGDRWNIDIWWKDKAQIDDSIAYANNIVHLMHKKPELKDAVMKIKQELIIRGLYGFDKGKKHYHSKEIYNAVFNEGIYTTEKFLTIHK